MNASTEYPGYFSLVRFVPDEFRGEGVNLGVLLLCPQLRRLEWRFTSNHRRALRFFRKEHDVDLGRLKAMKAGLQERLEAEQGRLLSQEGLGTFAKQFRNQVQLTDPRSCVISDFEEDLVRFFARLVEAEGPLMPEEETAIVTEQQLRATFIKQLRQRHLYERLEHEVQVPARYKPHPYEFSHAYENGKLQIIEEISFGRTDPDLNCDRAMALAVEIEDVVTQQPRGKDTAFTLVASFAHDQSDVERVIRRLFDDKKVGLYTLEQMEALLGRIEQELGC